MRIIISFISFNFLFYYIKRVFCLFWGYFYIYLFNICLVLFSFVSAYIRDSAESMSKNIVFVKYDIHYRLPLNNSSVQLHATKQHSPLQKNVLWKHLYGKVHKYNELSFTFWICRSYSLYGECRPKIDAFKTTFQHNLCRIKFLLFLSVFNFFFSWTQTILRLVPFFYFFWINNKRRYCLSCCFLLLFGDNNIILRSCHYRCTCPYLRHFIKRSHP